MQLHLQSRDHLSAQLTWDAVPGAARYCLRWSDRETAPEYYKPLPEVIAPACTFRRVDTAPYRLYVQALAEDGTESAALKSFFCRLSAFPSPSWKS